MFVSKKFAMASNVFEELERVIEMKRIPRQWVHRAQQIIEQNKYDDALTILIAVRDIEVSLVAFITDSIPVASKDKLCFLCDEAETIVEILAESIDCVFLASHEIKRCPISFDEMFEIYYLRKKRRTN